MLELRGKYNTATVFTNNIDSATIGQITAFLNQEIISGSQVHIMPDCHAGNGCVIGTTMKLVNAVVPYWVGSDIGCGMSVVMLEEKRINLPAFDSIVNELLSKEHGQDKSLKTTIDIKQLRCYGKTNIRIDKAYQSIGTLGGGNHFCELDKDENGNVYLIIHSGSRNLGREVCEYYQQLAYKRLCDTQNRKPSIPYEMAYLSGSDMVDYLHDMKMVQKYASDNRTEIARMILKKAKLTPTCRFETVHNYIDSEGNILRKGAVSAKKDELLLIPINMRDGSLLCVGKGNPDWNYSAPHGAGRLMSRSEAKQSFSLTEYKNTMKEAGVFTSSVGRHTLDECPMAYKPIDEIMANIENTVEVKQILRPIYNFKNGAE